MRSCSLLFLVALLAASCTGSADKASVAKSAAVPLAPAVAPGDPWKAEELLAPAVLAAQLRSSQTPPVVFDMGPAGKIKGAQLIGPAQDAANLTKLRAALATVPKDRAVVVYCGCCPFEPCPNIRPAFQLLKDEGFTQPRLLNLPHNLKADWIDAGYPMAD